MSGRRSTGDKRESVFGWGQLYEPKMSGKRVEGLTYGMKKRGKMGVGDDLRTKKGGWLGVSRE